MHESPDADETLPATPMLAVDPTATAATCTCCAPWWLPLRMRGDRPFGVALTYQEWLVYHLHTRLHQGQGLPS